MANPVLPATGVPVATETVGGVDFQKIKLIDPTEGSTQPIGTEENPVVTKPSPFSFLTSLAMRAVAKLTFSTVGLRVDCFGSSVVVASGTVTNVTTVNSINTLAGIGYNTQNGQGIQQSQLGYQCGFRRNIT